MLHHEADNRLLSVRYIGRAAMHKLLHRAKAAPTTRHMVKCQAGSPVDLGTTEIFALCHVCCSYVNSRMPASYQRPDYVLLSCGKTKNVMNGQLWLF